MGTSIGLASGLLSRTELNREFPLNLQPPGKSLPEGATLNNYTNTIPYALSTNLLYHTSADGNSHSTCHSTPSDNIHVTDHSFKNEVSRKLVYIPPDRLVRPLDIYIALTLYIVLTFQTFAWNSSHLPLMCR